MKETPYSAYITIRKRFVKSAFENQGALDTKQITVDNEEELNQLIERNKDLETRLALAKVEFEEMEHSKVKLLTDLSKWEDEIETFLKKERISNSNYENITKENTELKVVNDKISREKVHTSKHFEETIVMLENVLETREQTIYDLE